MNNIFPGNVGANLVSGGIQVDEGGIYEIDFGVNVTLSGQSSSIIFCLFKNGAAVANTNLDYFPTTILVSNYQSLTLTDIANPGDVYQVFNNGITGFIGSSNLSLTEHSQAYLSVRRIA